MQDNAALNNVNNSFNVDLQNLGTAPSASNKPNPKVYLNQAYPDDAYIMGLLKQIGTYLDQHPELLKKFVTLPFGAGLDTMPPAKLQGTPEWQNELSRKNNLLNATNAWANSHVHAGEVKYIPTLTLVRRVNDVIENVPVQDNFTF